MIFPKLSIVIANRILILNDQMKIVESCVAFYVAIKCCYYY